MARSTALVPRLAARPPALPAAPQSYVSSTPDLTEICRKVMDLQVQRRYLIVTQSRADRSIEGLLARLLGYDPQQAEVERKALFKMAKTMREKIEKAGSDWHPEGMGPQWTGISAYVLQSAAGRAIWDQFRKTVEGDMGRLARQLPVWAWVKDVKGVAEKGLAVIVGETGDLGGYAAPAKVWKRLGLAVFDGRRQGNPGAAVSAEAWIAHGYNPHRRAEVWAFLSDIMFRAQWRGDRDEDGKNPARSGKAVAVPAHPIGPYGELYAERKAWNVARGWTPKHADADARRIMSKRFLRDLWTAWNRQPVTMSPVDSKSAVLPAAD